MTSQAEALVAELRDYLGLETVALDEDGKVCLLLDEKRLLTIAYEEALQAFVLFTTIAEGEVAPGSWRRALAGNFLWEETAGATIAIEPETGAVVLQRLVPVAGMEFPPFVEGLEAFARIADGWSSLLQGDTEAPGDQERADPDPAVDPRFIVRG